MIEGPAGPSQPRDRRPIRPVAVANGLLVFLAANLLVLVVLGLGPASLTTGVLYAAAIVLLASVLYFLLDWRGFALGFVAGFVLLTLVSGGTCTLFAEF